PAAPTDTPAPAPTATSEPAATATPTLPPVIRSVPALAPTKAPKTISTHGHGHQAARHAHQSDNGDQDEANDDQGDHGPQGNHGAAVSQVARSNCTAVNPHNSSVQNHGMCVRPA